MRSMGRGAPAYAKRLGYLAVLVGALVWVGSAPGATPPPPEDVPAVSAYVELIPTSRGSRSPRRTARRTTPLSPSVEAQVAREGGSDADLLKEVATSTAYGAPERSAARPSLRVKPRSDDGALQAATGVATDGGDRRLIALALVLLAITAGAATAAAYRRRARR